MLLSLWHGRHSNWHLLSSARNRSSDTAVMRVVDMVFARASIWSISSSSVAPQCAQAPPSRRSASARRAWYRVFMYFLWYSRLAIVENDVARTTDQSRLPGIRTLSAWLRAKYATVTLATRGVPGRNRTCDLRRVIPAFLPLNYGRPSWIRGDSNPSPRRCHRRALPNELRTRRASGWSRTTVSGLSNRRLDRFSFRGIEQGEALLIFVVNYSFVIHDEVVCGSGSWIRTTLNDFRDRCPTARRSPSDVSACKRIGLAVAVGAQQS